MEINYKKIRPEQIVEVFEKNNVYFDRDIRIAALRKVLLTKYETEKKELEESEECGEYFEEYFEELLGKLKKQEKLNIFK